LTHTLPPLSRRHAIGLMAGPLVLGRGTAVRGAPPPPPLAPVGAVPFPEGATILVAGPDGGLLGRWGDTVAGALDETLPSGTRVHATCTGGIDGVTGANQFEARVAPDGATVLLAPGAAALDWLVGDPRAHFDAEHWVPVMAGVTPAIVMVRPDAMKPGPGRLVRLAASGPVGPQLPALLGLDLLGAHVTPIFGLVEQAAAAAAFASGKVDAVLAWGQNVPQQVADLRQSGGAPLFRLGAPDVNGAPARDPTFPDVPTLAELLTTLHGIRPAGARYDAWRAAATATQLEFGLVLPRLTSAAMVALWRRAASQAAAAPGVQALAQAFAVRPLEGVAAAAAMTGVAADAAALLELRGWLATRFNWRPT
jgi:hypothetical protein